MLLAIARDRQIDFFVEFLNNTDKRPSWIVISQRVDRQLHTVCCAPVISSVGRRVGVMCPQMSAPACLILQVVL